MTILAPEGLRHLAAGKVRDLYEVDGERLLLVASDRISAFDVVLGEPVPAKGEVLAMLTVFWLGELAGLVPNHLLAVHDLPAADSGAARPRMSPWPNRRGGAATFFSSV